MFRRSSLPKAHECALGEPILFEKLGDGLKIPAPWHIDWVFVPAAKGFLFGEVSWIVNMLVKIDMILNIMLLRMHVLPALQHEFAPHQPAAQGYQFLVERNRRCVSHALDGPVAGIGVDGRAREHERVHLIRKACRNHRGHPAALTQPDKIDAAAEIVDRHKNLGKVIVDLQILHIFGCGLPIGQGDVTDAIGQESSIKLWPLW